MSRRAPAPIVRNEAAKKSKPKVGYVSVDVVILGEEGYIDQIIKNVDSVDPITNELTKCTLIKISDGTGSGGARLESEDIQIPETYDKIYLAFKGAKPYGPKQSFQCGVPYVKKIE